MAKLVTEIYVSVKGKEYTKLDLHKDESFEMKYTTKDLQDISKIFAPYSQSFTFPASPKNLGAFGFFGYTDVVKINTENKFRCKVYVNGMLYLTGFLQLASLKYKKNKPTDFTGSFTTSMVNLKTRIGEDTIQNLGVAAIDYTPANIFTSLKSIKTIDVDGVTVKYYIPLASNSRVLAADNTFPVSLQDNIAYKSTSLPTSFQVLNPNEVRPAISLDSIFELIKKKYSLEIIAPIEATNEFNDAYVYCNNDKIENSAAAFRLLTVNTQFTDPNEFEFEITANLTDSSFKIHNKSGVLQTEIQCYFGVTLENITGVSVTGEPLSASFKILRKSNNQLLFSRTIDNIVGTMGTSFEFGENEIAGMDTEFYVYVKFNQLVSWTNCVYRFQNNPLPSSTYISTPNNNASVVGGNVLDIFKVLPNTKVVDFLGSFFKCFNISIFDSSPNNENLFFLTPGDIDTDGLEYSKTALDYTPYVNVTDMTKSTSSDYNYYNFKHVKSKYKSNVDFLAATGLEYGQTVYPAIRPTNPIEYKIETAFSIVPPRTMVGTVGNHTFYAFTSEAPKVLDSGESRYKPNFGELTILYSHGIQPLPVPIGVRTTNLANVTVTAQLSQYVKSMPFNLDGHSFAFSILVENNVEYPINLFSKYYANQIIRLLNPNVLTWEVELTLPPDEIYLNESTTVQNGGDTPTGFRLQNDIIIGENKFTILDAEIDITTGKTKMKLLNIK